MGDNDDDVILSQKPSIKSFVKIGSVIDEMLLFLLLLMLLLLFMLLVLIPETYLYSLVKIGSGTDEILLALSSRWWWVVLGGVKSFSY